MKSGRMNKNYFYLLFAILVWSTTPVITKPLTKTLSTIQINFFIFLFAVISLFFIILYQKKGKLLLSYSKKDYLNMFLMGTLGIFISYFLYTESFNHIPATEVTILDYSWPVFVVLLSFPILKEKFTYRKLFAILLGFLGAFLIISKGNIFMPILTNIKGDMIILGSAICWAIFSNIGKKVKYEKYSSMFYYMLAALIFLTIMMFYNSSFRLLKLNELLSLLYLGIATKALAFTFWFISMDEIGPAKASSLVFISPFLSIILINLFLGEQIYWYYIVSLLLIIGGILLQHIKINVLPEG